MFPISKSDKLVERWWDKLSSSRDTPLFAGLYEIYNTNKINKNIKINKLNKIIKINMISKMNRINRIDK